MKHYIITAIISIVSIISVRADDQFIQLCANAKVAGQQYSTPSVITKSGQKASVSYPVNKSEIIVSSESSLSNGILIYNITASIPSEDGTSKTEITSKGTTDKIKPLTYQFVSGGKSYALNVVLCPVTRDGKTL